MVIKKDKYTPLPQISSIAGLKMLGCFLILFHHISYFYAHIDKSKTYLTFYKIDLYPLLVNGWVGIYIFFTILGYFVMRSWWGDSQRNYKEYAFARMRRILPIYYFLMIFLLLNIYPDYITYAPPNLLSIIYHALMLPDIFLPDIMVLFATTAAEFKIVLLLPFILLSCMAHKKPARALLIAMVSLVIIGIAFRVFGYSQFYVVNNYFHDYFQLFLHTMFAFIYCLDPVVAGVAVAYLEHISSKRDKPIISKKQARLIFWAGIIILTLWLGINEKLLVITFYDGVFQMFVVGMITGILLLGVVFGGAPTFFSGYFSKNVARLSYAAYLVHIPLIATSYRITYIVPSIKESHIISFIYITATYLFLTWIAAELLNRYVEQPFVRKIRKYRENHK